MLQGTVLRSFIQLHTQKVSPDQMRVAAYLNERAEKIHSRVLSALVLRVQEDPFAKVKKMLRDLISRLQEEATEETQHKAWCDTELTENERVRNTRSAKVESLTAQIDNLKSSISQAAQKVADLTQQLSDEAANVAKATKIRQQDKKVNEATIADAQEAQAALNQAITILKEFYNQASQATALMQNQKKKQRQTPEIFEGAYTGMGGQSGGVVAMLEVIQSDFARLESSTRAAEQTAEQDFTKQMSESAIFKSQTGTDIQHLNHQKQIRSQQQLDAENDLMTTQKELTAANNYYDKLKPSCLEAGESYDERVRRRQEEIQSLQEALRILNGEDMAVLQQMD